MANEHLTMSQAEMLATIVNNADDDADVSHLTHSEAELWGAFYNIATSGNYPYPHLDLSTAELMAGIANGYGGDVSHLTSSPDALGAAIANALGADPPVSSLASGFGAILSSILESGVVPPTEPVTPNGPVGQAVNDTSGVFTFNAPSNGGSPITSSEFRWSLNQSDWTVIEDPDQPVTISGIDPETTVYAQVRFQNAVGWSGWSSSGTFITLEEVIPPNPPARPDAPVGASTGTTTGTFTFVEPEDNGGTEIIEAELRYIEPEGDWVVIDEAVSPEALTGLDPEVTIYAQVRFLNSVGWSEWSESGSFTTDAEAPADTVPAQPVAPIGQATGFDTGTFTFVEPFDGGSAITDVEFRYSYDESDWTDVPDPVSPVELTSLDAETVVYAQVRFENAIGWGDWSESGTFETEIEPREPGQANAPTGAATGPTSGTFTFSEPVDTGTGGIVASQLRWSYNETDWTVINDPISPREITGLTADTTVYGQVRFQNDVDWGAWSTSGSFATEAEATAPATPAEPVATVTGPTTASVTFVEPDDGGSEITDVEMRISTDESTWSDVPDPVSPVSLTGLTAETNYYVQVRFQNAVDWSAWSSSELFQTEAESEAVTVMSLEFDLGDYEIDGEEVTTSEIGFARSTAAYYFSNGFGSAGTVEEAATNVPVVAADGMLLRPSLAQLILEPAVPANFSNSQSATHSASAFTYSGITGETIVSGGVAAGRSGRGTGGNWTASQPYRLYWIYKYGTGTAPRFYAISGASTSHITITSGTPSATQTTAGTLTDIHDYELDAGAGVRMLSAIFTPGASSAASMAMGPNNATNGISIIGFGLNAFPTSEEPDFDKLQHTRGAETFMPDLPDGTYDILVVGPDDTEEWRYGVVWASGAWDESDWLDESETPQSTSPTAPIAGDDRVKRIYAYTLGGAEATVPATASAPVGTASSDTSGTFTFTTPANGGSAILSAELRWSDDEADWTTIAGAASPQAITGLTTETLYYAQVRFENAVGWGGWSPSGTFTTLEEDEEPGGEPFSIWGFQRPATAPTEFPGSLIIGDEQDGTDATKYIRQSNDAALSIAPGNMAASGAQITTRYIGYVDEDAVEVGDRLAIIAEIASASGNISVTSSVGAGSNTANARIGHKQACVNANSAAAPRVSVTFNAGVSGHFTRLRAYNLRVLLDRPWFIVFTAGQSNGVCSVATADPAIDTPIEGVVVFPGITNTYGGAQVDQPMIACEPIQHQTLNGSSAAYGGGPMGECLRELRKRIPEDFVVVCVPLNYAGQGFKTNGYWNKDATPNTAYTNFWTRLRYVWSQAPSGSIMGGFFFCGGESDLGGANLTAWASETTGVPALINEIRAEEGWGDVPVVFMEIGMDNSLSNVQAMIALQQRLATGSGDPLEFTRCKYVSRPAGWVTVDGTHYDQATHRQRGYDAAIALLDIIYDGAPPPDEGGEGGDFSNDFNEDFG